MSIHTIRDLLHVANLLHATVGFTSPPKEGVPRIFLPLKIGQLRLGLNPWTWVRKASALRLDHRSCCYCSIYTQNNHHYYGHQTVDDDSVKKYCMAFYGYNGSKCTEDKVAIQKYFSTDEKYICKGNRNFMQNCPNAKDLQKSDTLEIPIVRKKRKMSVLFSRNVWHRKEKKNIFTMIQFLLLPFLKKPVKFSHNSPFHPHPKQHRIFSAYLCAASWSIRTIKKAAHCTELQ